MNWWYYYSIFVSFTDFHIIYNSCFAKSHKNDKNFLYMISKFCWKGSTHNWPNWINSACSALSSWYLPYLLFIQLIYIEKKRRHWWKINSLLFHRQWETISIEARFFPSWQRNWMIKVITLPFCSNITKQGKQHIKICLTSIFLALMEVVVEESWKLPSFKTWWTPQQCWGTIRQSSWK